MPRETLTVCLSAKCPGITITGSLQGIHNRECVAYSCLSPAGLLINMFWLTLSYGSEQKNVCSLAMLVETTLQREVFNGSVSLTIVDEIMQNIGICYILFSVIKEKFF